MRKMKWIIVITMFLLGVSFSMNYETTIIDGYKVVKGERAFIDLSKVPADSYEPGKLTIKLKEGFSTKSQERFINPSSKGYVEVGIESLDQINKSVGAQKYDRKFYSLYEIPEGTIHSVAKFTDRHKAWGFDRVYEITFDENQDVIAAVKQYASQEGIEYAEPVYKKKMHAPVEVQDVTQDIIGGTTAGGSKWTPNDPNYATLQWHYNNTGQSIGGVVGIPGVDVRAVTAWDIEKGNPLFVTAVIDQGIDYDHPDIAPNMWSGRGWNFTDNTATINPGDHGSHTSATISGVTNNGIGIAGLAGGDGTAGTGSKVMSCQVFDDTSGGFDLAFIWAADHGASIGQNSWGYTSAGVFEQTVLDAIDYFSANGGQDGGLEGGIVMFSAGNDGTDDEWYPAYYDGVMAVASHDNKGKKSSFSNYGTWVEITAPGTNVYSCNGTGGYMVMSGTSMACPHVSGAAAMIVANSEGVLTAADMKTILSTSVWNIYAYETNTTYAGKLGTGALDASAALVLTQEYLGGVPTADDFAATGTSTTQNNLTWSLNEFNDNVLVAWALDGNTIGDPVDQTVYSVGNTLPGGGTVIYYGSGTSYNHTGLTPQTTYDYKIWSRAAAERQDNQGEWYQVGTYSNDKSTTATTLMAPLPPSAASLGFENSGSIPMGWTQEGNWTFVTTATRPTAPSEGSYFAYFNTVSSTKKLVTPRFDLTTHTGVSINFDYFVGARKVGPTTWTDVLKVYYKTSLAGSWVQLGSTYTGTTTNSTWMNANLTISDAVRTNDFYFAFEAIEGSTIGYGVSVDDIIINGTAAGAPGVPTLISPANTSSTSDLTPTFDWNDVSGATSYTIQIDNTSNFSSPEYTNSPTVSTYTPGTNLATGTWYWRVLATNTYGSSSYTSGWSVILGNAPGVPTLALPANASSTSDLTPTFDWNDVSGATSYTILVDNNSDYSSPEINQSPTASTYTPGTNMATGTYYWKVLATNAFGSSVYTASWTVTLGNLPAVPTLATPADASTLYILKPVFDWNDVSGATTYTILVDNNSDFSSAEINQSPTVSTYTPAADMAIGTYYWKVLSTNSFGSSSYSGTWSVILAPLSAPINVITGVSGTDLTVSWDAVAGATSYDVYSSTEPYGTYTLVTNVATNSYVTTTASARLFWYVVAKN